MTIRYDGQVAIVTGAGNGLGKSHALQLAARGAKVVVNDLGGTVDGSGGGSDASQAVVAEIEAAGGEAMAHGANVADFDQVQDMVSKTMERWGRVDILINNAGILRDKSFGKGSLDDFKLVLDVHLLCWVCAPLAPPAWHAHGATVRHARRSGAATKFDACRGSARPCRRRRAHARTPP